MVWRAFGLDPKEAGNLHKQSGHLTISSEVQAILALISTESLNHWPKQLVGFNKFFLPEEQPIYETSFSKNTLEYKGWPL